MTDVAKDSKSGPSTLQVRKIGNSIGFILPKETAARLDLKEGEEIEIQVAGARVLEVARKPSNRELLSRLRRYRGRLPADFRFDRLDANERG